MIHTFFTDNLDNRSGPWHFFIILQDKEFLYIAWPAVTVFSCTVNLWQGWIILLGLVLELQFQSQCIIWRVLWTMHVYLHIAHTWCMMQQQLLWLSWYIHASFMWAITSSTSWTDFLLPNYRTNILKESFPWAPTKWCSPVTCLYLWYFSQQLMHSQNWRVDRGHLSPFCSIHLLCWRAHSWISRCKEVLFKQLPYFAHYFYWKEFFFQLPA